MATKKTAKKTTMPRATARLPERLVIVAGDCGVYVGYLDGGAASVDASGRVLLRNARHLRRYTVAGKTGDGSVSDLAARGLDPSSAAPSNAVIGISTLLGVRRVFDVAAAAAASFAVPL